MNLTGQTNTGQDFVCLSDGGHFDNMGLYELVRRRCKTIILCDGEQDSNYSCEGLANAIRRCRIDFGVEIQIDVTDITPDKKTKLSKCSYVKGSINYPGDDGKPGALWYIKSSLSNTPAQKIPVDVLEYSMKNDTFPQQTTADQFFDEEQFESYRKLGFHIGECIFSDPTFTL